MTEKDKRAIAILTATFLLVWTLVQGGDNRQPKLQIELRIEYGSS